MASDSGQELRKLRRHLDWLEAMASTSGSWLWQDHWDQSTLRGTVPAQQLDLGELTEFAAAGNAVEVAIGIDGFETNFVADNTRAFVAQGITGQFEQAFDDPDAAREAYEDRRLGDLLAQVDERHVEVTLRLINSSRLTGFRWIRSAEWLADQFAADWLGIAKRITAEPTPIIVQDSGQWLLRTPALTLFGSDDDVVPAASPSLDGAIDPTGYRQQRLDAARRDLPTPSAFYPIEVAGQDGSPQETLQSVFRKVTVALCWLWLAARVENEPDGHLIASFAGSPSSPIEIRLNDLPAEEDAARDARDLWMWLVRDPNAARVAAFEQAVMFTLRTSDDLGDAAGIVRRSAEFLYDVAERDLIAEAMAARRSARESALTVARATADQARTTSQSTFDRAVLQAAAAVGILIAFKGDLLEPAVAVVLLAAILAILLCLGAAAISYELRAASTALNAFEADLELYREVLLREDIDAIKRLTTLEDAKNQISRSRRATLLALGLAGVTVVLILGSILRPLFLPNTPAGSSPRLAPAWSHGC